MNILNVLRRTDRFGAQIAARLKLNHLCLGKRFDDIDTLSIRVLYFIYQKFPLSLEIIIVTDFIGIP